MQTQTAARGAAIVTVDALNMVLIAVLVFLFMRQVMPIASSLASGAALNTMGTVSRAGQLGGPHPGSARCASERGRP